VASTSFFIRAFPFVHAKSFGQRAMNWHEPWKMFWAAVTSLLARELNRSADWMTRDLTSFVERAKGYLPMAWIIDCLE
jgi:hypothetical protein